MMTRYVSAGRTVTGKVRKHNEDSILVRDEVGLWVVADGLGGHSAGDYASSMIVERLGALPRSGSALDFIEAIEDTLSQVNAELLQTAATRGVDLIGSTVVVLVHDGDYMLCGWVGDSRVYCFEDGQLRQITRDHVHGGDDDVTHFGAPAAPAQAGSGVLTRAVGAEEHLFVDWVVAGNRPGMGFVLCSDGINKEMSDAELDDECRRHPQPQDLVASLFDLAMSRAGRDNISAVVVRIQE
ncbi:Protein phosphatase [Rhodanobacter sp. Root179]|jgi:protein phosphatase|uniref:PP2C family protein-serine/threonine phosphatase n=1 Tax=unclassified Rhodanobacter TaxID=2621553 RepID=UPI000700A65B|nr:MULTISPECIES: PP2C family serine/threonine-protein phosphatase [unclassified Rhodanobacter]KQZ68464.1 phosphoprotein phosphatase [Rhodanobacter sp. Root561]KRB43152.1 phosphoprotein phosphatase [Rhodanobacter sp. Root179]QRP65680.1 serine/threonine-protein phosphatase [Rhodanobacter sp. FDAARGOS 1247]